MKQKLHTLLCLLLALALPVAAFAAQADEEIRTLEGVITEIVEGGFLLHDNEQGDVMLNLSESTVWEGLSGSDELEIGLYVAVEYDGRMTRSLPPQAHADRVSLYLPLNGSVLEIYEDGSFLMSEETNGEVLVHTEEILPLYEGMDVTVYHNGAMTLSLPAQVSARRVIVPELTGTVSEWTQERFLLTDADGKPYEILMNKDTPINYGPIEMEAEEANAPLSVDWGDDSTVTVYYNGAMTRSLPAQVTALELLIHE